MKNNPIHAASRIPLIDFIRGIGLLGILIINIQTYSLFAFLNPEQVYALKLDEPATYAPTQFFVHLFVKGQFYTLFSFLFGLGSYLMWEKNTRNGLDAGRIFKRRMWILLVIGLIHGLIFWFGDVLHKYALLGFTLPYFNRKSVPVILRWIAAMVAAVIVFQVLNIVWFVPSTASGPESAAHQMIMEVIRIWQTGSPGEVAGMQWIGVLMLYARSFENIMHYEIMFLAGLIAGKMNVFYRLKKLRVPLIRLSLWLFPLSLLMKAVSCLPVTGFSPTLKGFVFYEPLVFSLTSFISIPLLTIIYLIELSVLAPRLPRWLAEPIVRAGRMSLTNYLMQTVICTVLFYGFAGGLSGKLSLLQSVFIAFLIYLFQLVCSTTWFRFFSVGPVESVFRKWIYTRQD